MTHPLATDLLRFIDASPSPFHAVRTAAAELEDAGFRPVDESDAWRAEPGDRLYTVRDGASLAAFVVGTRPVEESGFRLIAAHTDSPTLRVKPSANVTRHGYAQLAVEVYGGVLLHTWLDRDLSLAGRVWLRGARGPEPRDVDLGNRLRLRVPSLAIHLNRNVNTEGLTLNPQDHLAPVLGLEGQSAASLQAQLAETLDAEQDALLAWELSAYSVEPSAFGGVDGAFLFAPRLDNLAGCHGALRALLDSGEPGSATRGIVLFDHEECGSQSVRGARSNLLENSLRRVASAHRSGTADEEGLARALTRSTLISSDMAHGVHPNYADRHESGHRPVLGKGPVLKSHANQAYATDAQGWAHFEYLARELGVSTQRFVSRNDLACGSTVGPMTAARLGLRTLDVGNPMLSMHSAREMAASADVEPMLRLLRAFLTQ